MDRFSVGEENRVFVQCVESCGEPVMITDLHGVLVYVNPAWCKIYGFSREMAIGKTPRLLRSHQQNSEFYVRMWEKILDPKVGFWKGELVNRSRDGREVPVLLTITPFKAEDGTKVGFMGIALDLTEEKQLRAQVEQQDRLATIGILTSGMAHEIGTPIGVIRGRAELMLMDARENEKLRKNLEIVIRQTDRISVFINSLLKLSRSSGDQHLEAVDSSVVIKEVLDLLAPKVRNSHIELEMKFEEGLIAWADVGRLEQVMINLVMNAIHAIERKRELCDLAAQSAQYIRILTCRSLDRIKVSVEDSGCGIPESHLKKIFEPFFTTKPAGKGTGLGLSIVSRIISEMGGHLCVESTEGQSSKFTFTLTPA